jgi:hypothetical protein
MPRPSIVYFVTISALFVATARAANPAPVVTIDLTDPCKTYRSFLDARLANDLPKMLQCVTYDAAKKAQVDTLLAHEVAKQQLEAAALLKFGPDASKVILDTTRPIRDELQAQQKRVVISRAEIDKDGNAATLFLRPERDVPDGVTPFDEGLNFIKVGEQWKLDGTKFMHQDDGGDPDRAQALKLGVTIYGTMTQFMNALTADINKGKYDSAAQVRAALDAKWNALGDNIPAPPDATPAPANPGTPAATEPAAPTSPDAPPKPEENVRLNFNDPANK